MPQLSPKASRTALSPTAPLQRIIFLPSVTRDTVAIHLSYPIREQRYPIVVTAIVSLSQQRMTRYCTRNSSSIGLVAIWIVRWLPLIDMGRPRAAGPIYKTTVFLCSQGKATATSMHEPHESHILHTAAAPTVIDINPSGEYVAVGCEDGNVCIFKLLSGGDRPLHTLTADSGWGEVAISSAAWISVDVLLCGRMNGLVLVVKIESVRAVTPLTSIILIGFNCCRKGKFML